MAQIKTKFIENLAVSTPKIADNAVTNAKAAQVASQTIKGRTTAGTGNVEDLTATQATAILNNFVGDSGSGGTKGLVPAPAAGDTAASKFLKADGTWETVATGSEFSDADFRINDDGDPTKQIAFEAAGIATTTTRTISMPDADVNLGDISENSSSIGHLQTLSGVAADSDDLGTFTGSTIPDASDMKEALQSLETSVETKADSSVVSEIDQNVDDLISLSGVAENATTLGTFTGTTIPDSSTVKAALQSLETSVETKAASSVVSEIDQNVDDLITLSGVAENATNLGAFSGSTIPDNQSNKQALQALETAVELRALDSVVIKKDGSVAFTAAQSMGGFKLTNMADPTVAQDAATKAYVDSVAEGLKPKAAVRAGTLIPGVLLTSFEDGDIIDGVTLATDDRILIKDQVLPAENGIYIVQASGAPVRSPDFDSLSPIDEINGSYTFIQEGSQAGQGWAQTGSVTLIDTDPINFVYFNSVAGITGGDMISVTGQVISVDLLTNGGLKSSNPGNSAGQLQVSLEASNPSLEVNGSNELKAKLDGAGTITSGASGLKVGVDASTIEISSNALRVKDAGITLAKLASNSVDENKIVSTSFNAAGAVTGGSGTKIAVQVDGSTIEINTNALRVKDAGITLAKLASNSVDENKIVSTTISTTGGLNGGSGTKLSSRVDASTVKINASNNLESLKHREQKFTLSGTDITNQYVDLAAAAHGADAANNSLALFAVGGPMQEKAVDYTVSLTGGSGGVTRVTFAGDLATGGNAALVAADILVISYDYLT